MMIWTKEWNENGQLSSTDALRSGSLETQ